MLSAFSKKTALCLFGIATLAIISCGETEKNFGAQQSDASNGATSSESSGTPSDLPISDPTPQDEQTERGLRKDISRWITANPDRVISTLDDGKLIFLIDLLHFRARLDELPSEQRQYLLTGLAREHASALAATVKFQGANRAEAIFAYVSSWDEYETRGDGSFTQIARMEFELDIPAR